MYTTAQANRETNAVEKVRPLRSSNTYITIDTTTTTTIIINSNNYNNNAQLL